MSIVPYVGTAFGAIFTFLMLLCFYDSLWPAIAAAILFWGVTGMILFLPFAAMFKVFCQEYEELKPIALLIGDHDYKEKDSGSKFVGKRFTKVKEWFSNFHA